jgi:hypothetical protein
MPRAADELEAALPVCIDSELHNHDLLAWIRSTVLRLLVLLVRRGRVESGRS